MAGHASRSTSAVTQGRLLCPTLERRQVFGSPDTTTESLSRPAPSSARVGRCNCGPRSKNRPRELLNAPFVHVDVGALAWRWHGPEFACQHWLTGKGPAPRRRPFAHPPLVTADRREITALPG